MIDRQRLQSKVNKEPTFNYKATDRYRSYTTQGKNVGSCKREGKLIRKQKIVTQKTVEDQPAQKLTDLYIYEAQTPQYIKTEKPDIIKKIDNEDVNSFKMEDSFENRHGTVKRQYCVGPYNLTKNDITLCPKKLGLKDKGPSKDERNKSFKSQHDQEIERKQSGNGLLKLSKGWIFKGQYVEGLFHGYGELYHNDSLIYSGTFQFGYFNGYGKLQYHPSFSYLIKSFSVKQKLDFLNEIGQSDNIWNAYFGQFLRGNITGYGQLWLSTGEKLAARWEKGSIKGKNYMLKDLSQS